MLLNNCGVWHRTGPWMGGDVVGTIYADDSDTEDDSNTEDNSDTEGENDETGLIIIDCSSEDESDYEEDLTLSKKLEQLAGEMLNDRQIV